MSPSLRQNFARSARVAVLAVAFLALVASTASAADWDVGTAHSKVGFTISHFLTPVEGRFTDFEIDLAYDPAKPEATHIAARIKIASIDTSNDRRDGHLKSADFFEADKYPMITFESSSVEAAGENQLLAHGTLTIKDQSKAVDLPITVLGIQAVPAELQGNFGKEVASFSAKLSIDRRDYGVGVGNWAATLVVGSNVDIDLVVEANHQ